MRAFQEEHHALTLPGGGHLDVALEPRGTGVVFLRLEPERKLEVVRPGVRREFGFLKPLRVLDATDPLRIERWRVADTLRGQRAG
jgi:hypothetical protein